MRILGDLLGPDISAQNLISELDFFQMSQVPFGRLMLALPRTEIRCRAIGFFLLRARCGSGLNLPPTLQLVGNFFQSAFGRRPHVEIIFYVPLVRPASSGRHSISSGVFHEVDAADGPQRLWRPALVGCRRNEQLAASCRHRYQTPRRPGRWVYLR